ncbi:cytoplasmic protein, partial [Pseudomonas syringae pv. tagetis]
HIPPTPPKKFPTPNSPKPHTLKTPPSHTAPIPNKKPIILFEISRWSDARVNATLFDGIICYDHCNFNEHGDN